MSFPVPRPGILDITPYAGGTSPALQDGTGCKLSSNESALGASRKAAEAYRASAGMLFRYPDGGCDGLRKKIASTHDLDETRIVCGAGSDEILQLLVRAYAGEGDSVVQTEHGFLLYALAAKSCGATPVFAREKNLATDVDAVIRSVDGRTRVVFIANPNNPTGTYISVEKLRLLRRKLREDILLVIDAAYAEYMEEPDYDPGSALVDEFPNVVMTRTFSKIYGLAALRLGWGYCSRSVADVLNRIRGPFNVSAPAQSAGTAALGDRDFIVRNRDHNRTQRTWLEDALAKTGLEAVPGHANFLLVKFPDTDGMRARDTVRYLDQEGISVRRMDAYGLDAYLRVSVGTADANRRFIECLQRRFD